MDIKNIIKLSVIVIIIDFIYLKLLGSWFNNVISSIQGKGIELDIIAVILCYLFIIFVLKYFVINKNFTYIESFSLGLSIYGIYEMTNKAILENWDWISVGIDTIWGGILFVLSTYLYNLIDI